MVFWHRWFLSSGNFKDRLNYTSTKWISITNPQVDNVIVCCYCCCPITVAVSPGKRPCALTTSLLTSLHPQQHRQDIWTEEADRCRRKLLWVELYIMNNKCIRNCVTSLLVDILLLCQCFYSCVSDFTLVSVHHPLLLFYRRCTGSYRPCPPPRHETRHDRRWELQRYSLWRESRIKCLL